MKGLRSSLRSTTSSRSPASPECLEVQPADRPPAPCKRAAQIALPRHSPLLQQAADPLRQRRLGPAPQRPASNQPGSVIGGAIENRGRPQSFDPRRFENARFFQALDLRQCVTGGRREAVREREVADHVFQVVESSRHFLEASLRPRPGCVLFYFCANAPEIPGEFSCASRSPESFTEHRVRLRYRARAQLEISGYR